MSEEKQIEEMAEDLETAKVNALATIGSMNDGFGAWYAKALYNAGYRKQSEGHWEIVKGSNGKEKMVCTNCQHQQDLASTFTYCPNCGAKMGGGAE